MKYLLPFIILSITVYSCGGDSSETTDRDEDLIDETSEDLFGSDDFEFVDTSENAELFYGFIGDAAVTVQLDFSGEMVSGSYFYNKYEKEIKLKGEATDWYAGEIYTLQEFDKNREPSAAWEWFRMNDSGVYEGRFVLKDAADDEDWSYIVLMSADSERYIDPESKMLFENKKDADSFFMKHKFLNDETKGKGGIIKYDANPEEEYGNAVPKVIKVYQHCGADGFCVDEAGMINVDGDLEYPDGSTEKLWEAGFPTVEIGYELSVLKFSDVVDNEFVACSGEGFEIYLKIEDLEKKGYHLEGDGYWIKQKSGNVLGFFPAYYGDYETGFSHPEVKIYEEMSSDSKVLYKTDNDNEGFFSLQNTEVKGRTVWAEVAFDFHTEEPCGGETYEFKPSLLGYIKLYQYDEENYFNRLVLGYYSRGC